MNTRPKHAEKPRRPWLFWLVVMRATDLRLQVNKLSTAIAKTKRQLTLIEGVCSWRLEVPKDTNGEDGTYRDDCPPRPVPHAWPCKPRQRLRVPIEEMPSNHDNTACNNVTRWIDKAEQIRKQGRKRDDTNQTSSGMRDAVATEGCQWMTKNPCW